MQGFYRKLFARAVHSLHRNLKPQTHSDCLFNWSTLAEGCWRQGMLTSIVIRSTGTYCGLVFHSVNAVISLSPNSTSESLSLSYFIFSTLYKTGLLSSKSLGNTAQESLCMRDSSPMRATIAMCRGKKIGACLQDFFRNHRIVLRTLAQWVNALA